MRVTVPTPYTSARLVSRGRADVTARSERQSSSLVIRTARRPRASPIGPSTTRSPAIPDVYRHTGGIGEPLPTSASPQIQPPSSQPQPQPQAQPAATSRQPATVQPQQPPQQTQSTAVPIQAQPQGTHPQYPVPFPPVIPPVNFLSRPPTYLKKVSRNCVTVPFISVTGS